MSTTTIRLWYIRSTYADAGKAVEKARLYCRRDVDTTKQGWRSPAVDEDCLWVPASIIEHTTRRGNEHMVKLPDWFIEEKGL